MYTAPPKSTASGIPHSDTSALACGSQQLSGSMATVRLLVPHRGRALRGIAASRRRAPVPVSSPRGAVLAHRAARPRRGPGNIARKGNLRQGNAGEHVKWGRQVGIQPQPPQGRCGQKPSRQSGLLASRIPSMYGSTPGHMNAAGRAACLGHVYLKASDCLQPYSSRWSMQGLPQFCKVQSPQRRMQATVHR